MNQKENKRSEKFDYFTRGNDPKEVRKDKLRNIWKYTKIVIYILVAALTLTGCVQNFTHKTSSQTGGGVELYRNSDKIAPKITVFDTKEKSQKINSLNDDTESTIKLPTFSVNNDKNYYESKADIIAKLKEQTSSVNGVYGEEKGYSSSIAIYNSNGENLSSGDANYIYSNGDKYLFKASSSQGYESLFGDDIQEFYVVAPVASFNKDDATKVDTVFSWEPTKLVDGQDETKKLKTYVFSTESNKNYFALGYVPKQLSINPNSLANYNGLSETEKKIADANIKYKRDVLNLLYVNSVAKWQVSEHFNNKDISTFIKEDIYDKLANGEEVRLNTNQINLINTYNQVMFEYLNLLDINIVSGGATNQVFNAEISNFSDGSARKIEYSSISYSLPLRNDVAQRPITNWGQAWKQGPFFGLLVYPISYVTQSLRQSFSSDLNGWASIISIFITVIVIRSIGLALSFKGIVSQSIQEELRTKKAAIEAKYKGFENNKQMKLRKQSEISALYKKHNIRPLDSFASTVVSMPIFFAMWRVIQGLPEIKSTVWLGINFGSTSYQKLLGGEWQYLFIIVLAVVLQFISQFLPRYLNKRKMNERLTIAESEALKKSEKTQRMMSIFFLILTVIFSAGVQVYWVFGSIFTITQTILIHKLKKTKWWRTKYSRKFA